jgi:hypothetical protein
MHRLHLYDKFAINITKQRTQEGTITKPKAFSVGWVACFNEAAARAVVTHIKAMGTEELFPQRNDWLFEHWKKFGIPGITLKDLRRSSLYYLGHRVGMEFSGLSAHARHAKPETTMLYLRRPEENMESLDLDLDA